MAIVEHRGLRIEHSDDGAGPPVVLLHSSVSGRRQWRRLIEQLAPHHRVVAPELHGYGATSAWPEHAAVAAPTLADAAQLVLALVDALGLDAPLRLVGHSWGGAVALQAATLLPPQRVSHLALHEPMLPGLLRPHARLEAAAEMDALYGDVQRLARAGRWLALAERFTEYFNGDGSWAASDAVRRQRIADALPVNVHEWHAAMAPLRDDAFAGIRARVLLMRGRATRPALAEIVSVLHRRFAHATLVDVAGCGHMAPLTHAEVINRRIVAFLAAGEPRHGNAGPPVAGSARGGAAVASAPWNCTLG